MLLVISLALVLNGIALKQQFNEYNYIELINGKSQTNRDQKSNLLFLQQHNIEGFNSSLLKINKTSYKDIVSVNW